jgi:hypothetical protein
MPDIIIKNEILTVQMKYIAEEACGVEPYKTLSIPAGTTRGWGLVRAILTKP